jgi:multiple sugar transport system substrate-binding protein
MTSPVKLNLWVMPNAGFDTRRVMRRELAIFQKENPGCRVELTVHPWYFAWDRLMSVAKKLDSEDRPDVIQIGSTWTTSLAALGALAEITDFLNDVDRTDIIRPTWNYCYDAARTKAYSLPWFIDTRVLYYRNDILSHMGVKPEQLQSWKGFREACERLRDSKKLSKQYFALALPGQREGVLIHDIAPWVWGAGGSFLNSNRREAQFHEDAALNGMHFFFQMIVDRLIPLLGRERVVPGNFFSGKFAFQISGAWPANTVFNPKYPYYQPEVARNYGISIFPAGPAGQVTFLGGSNLAIVNNSRHTEAAWKLISFLTGVHSQVRHSREIGMPPSRYTALEELLASAPAEVAEGFRHSLRIARTLPAAASLGTIERIIGRANQELIGAVRDGRYSESMLQATMTEAAREATYILSLYE